jgi:hypothetical protein
VDGRRLAIRHPATEAQDPEHERADAARSFLQLLRFGLGLVPVGDPDPERSARSVWETLVAPPRHGPIVVKRAEFGAYAACDWLIQVSYISA